MNCNDKKKFRTSEASSKASLRTKGAIDKFLNILDTNLFRKYNKQWSQDARERFNISGSLFYEENNKAIPNKEAFRKIDVSKGINYQKLTEEEKSKTIYQVTKEHRSITAIKDLSAKLAYRIGGKVEFQNHPNADWKGYNQGMTSVLNEAYMTPDTPFHEIAFHPIIRALKSMSSQIESVTLQQMIDNQEIEKECS